MTFESATTVLVTCLALVSLAVGLTLVLLAARSPEPVRVRADEGPRGQRRPSISRDRDPGCHGIDH